VKESKVKKDQKNIGNFKKSFNSKVTLDFGQSG
jgi:hypothetical protein